MAGRSFLLPARAYTCAPARGTHGRVINTLRAAIALRVAMAAAEVEPIASGPSYAADVARARRPRPLVEAGHAADLVEAALRFAITPEAIGTVLVGTSSLAELQHAVAAVRKGPLCPQALRLLDALPRS